MRVGAQLLLTFLLNASWQVALVVAFVLRLRQIGCVLGAVAVATDRIAAA